MWRPSAALKLIRTAACAAETNAEEHRLELQRGRLSAVISAPPKLFFVNTPGVAEDPAAPTLEVDDDGNSILHVTLGWVALQLLIANPPYCRCGCAMKRGFGPGTPYYEDATQSFRSLWRSLISPATEREDRSAGDSSRRGAARDAMTLW
jgi:hypothetical protein